jgi:hypothetical protein
LPIMKRKTAMHMRCGAGIEQESAPTRIYSERSDNGFES